MNTYSGSPGSIPGNPKTFAKTQMLAPSDAKNDATTVAINTQRQRHRAQQQDEDQEHQHQRDRDDQPVVAL